MIQHIDKCSCSTNTIDAKIQENNNNGYSVNNNNNNNDYLFSFDHLQYLSAYSGTRWL